MLLVLLLMSDVRGAGADQPQVSLSRGSNETWNMDWNGIPGRTYFIQWSLDLIHWDYSPTMDFGEHPEPYGFETEGSSRFFVRLHYIDADGITTLQEAKDADFDGDKVRNQNELENGTNPFQWLDTDSDGMPNDWETAHGFNPADSTDATLDWDSDGNSNSQEFQQDTNPRDYASRTLPVMAIYEGDNQVSSPSSILPQPLVVRVTDAGGVPLSNVPLQFDVAFGGGLVASAPDDPLPASGASVFTDANGMAGVWYVQPGGFEVLSSIKVIVTSGPDQGIVTFAAQTVSASLANDDFANALPLFGNEGSVNSSNRGASVEIYEATFLTLEYGAVSSQGGNLVRQTGATVWFSWQAPETRKYRFQTGVLIALENGENAVDMGNGTDFDTVLAAYQGNGLQTLTLVQGNDDSDTVESVIEFDATAGQTYHIAVDGAEGQSGKFFLSWLTAAPPGPPAPLPANDGFSDAKEISGMDGSVTGTTVGATKQSGEPNRQFHEGRHSIWYRWQAPQTGMANFDTEGSQFNTILGIYQGTVLESLVELAWNDDNETLRARAGFPVTEGQTYYIMVDGFDIASGPLAMKWHVKRPPPVNDDFANAFSILSGSGTLSGSIREATAETGEPSHAGTGPGQSIWYRWTAPGDGTYTFLTAGSEFDTVLAIYTGSSVANLTEVGSNDDGDGLASVLSIVASQGTSYSLAVDVYTGTLSSGESGVSVLSWVEGLPPQPPGAQEIPDEIDAGEPIQDSLLFQSASGTDSSANVAESEAEPNKGDTFVSEEDETIVLLAPKAGQLSVACPVSFDVGHSIVTFDTPRERDLKGKLSLFVEGDSSLISLNDYTPGTPIAVTEPGHVGGGVHDWHSGTESFNITGLKSGNLTLRAEVDPDAETPEGDGEPRTKATINVQVLAVNQVILYESDTSTDAEWLSAAKELRWGRIINKGGPLKIKLVLSGAVPEGEDVDLCSLSFALYKFDESYEDAPPANAFGASHRFSPGRNEIWVTVDSATVEAQLARFNSSDNEFASVEAPGSASFADSEAFDSWMNTMPDSQYLVPARYGGNDTDTAITVAAGTIPPFSARTTGDYPRYGGAVYLQAEMINMRSERRLYRNQADILYISSHGMSKDGSIASVVPGTVDWKDDLEIAILAGCSVLDINDYNGNYDNDGDGKPEPGPVAHVFSGEQWALTGPETFLGYNYKAPLDTQGTPGIVNSWFAHRVSGDIEAWKIANDNSAGRNACAIDAVGGNYYYFKRSGKVFRNYTWTVVPRASW